jgi:hypothetical protein
MSLFIKFNYNKWKAKFPNLLFTFSLNFIRRVTQMPDRVTGTRTQHDVYQIYLFHLDRTLYNDVEWSPDTNQLSRLSLNVCRSQQDVTAILCFGNIMLSLVHPRKKKPTEFSEERGARMIGPPQPINVPGKYSINYPLGEKSGEGCRCTEITCPLEN